MNSSDDSRLQAIVEWFAKRGFGLRLTREDEDLVWADLTQQSTGDVVVPRFGRGETPLAAAERAKQRYEQEE